ncbi:MAG: hypothetical protein GY846_05640 [Deltaproteobacteria bacterium]|nr:hypothetical protein [Deltaproteobacteria bacterium]
MKRKITQIWIVGAFFCLLVGCDGDSSSVFPLPEKYYVFYYNSGERLRGDSVGARETADRRCQDAADDPSSLPELKGKQWQAWLSYTGGDEPANWEGYLADIPLVVLEANSEEYVVVSDFNTLLSLEYPPDLQHSISYDQYGQSTIEGCGPGGDIQCNAWTGTSSSGHLAVMPTGHDTNCHNWSPYPEHSKGVFGGSKEINGDWTGSWWRGISLHTCTDSGPMYWGYHGYYCFEKP